MRAKIVALMIVVVAGGSFATRAYCQPNTFQPQAAAAAGQESPEKILRQMADFVGKLPAFSFNVESAFDIKSKEQNSHQSTKMTVRLARPNRLAMIVDEGAMGITIVSDGKQVVQFLPMIHQYVVKPAPADLVGIADIGAPLPVTMLGGSDVVIPTNAEEFYKRLTAGVTKSECLGQEKVGEVLCHHCRFMQEEFDWDIWIEVGQRPVVHKVQPDLTKQLADAGPRFEGVKLSYIVTLTDWNVAAKFTDADFTFTPPAGAQKVDSFFEEPPHPLVGQPAAAFTTTNLEGKPINLKDSLGKKVVLLDFWATWCGPCVQAMPQVEEVAAKFKEKGLVFYAVNQGEDAETIKAFLTESKLNPPVILDPKHEIGGQYGVEGIPQTVLIGMDGKVQVVHVGFNARLGKTLTKEIEDLLAGKDLAKEALAKAAAAQKSEEAAGPGTPAQGQK